MYIFPRSLQHYTYTYIVRYYHQVPWLSPYPFCPHVGQSIVLYKGVNQNFHHTFNLNCHIFFSSSSQVTLVFHFKLQSLSLSGTKDFTLDEVKRRHRRKVIFFFLSIAIQEGKWKLKRIDLKGGSTINYSVEAPSCQEAASAAMEGNILFCKTGSDNPFLDAFGDPLCKLNLKETSEFVKSFPMTSSNNGTGDRGGGGILEMVSGPGQGQRREGGGISMAKRSVEAAPPTPGRPVFSFSVGNLSRKGFPSKWDDAEKWVIGGSSCHDSPAHNHHHHGSKISSRQCNVIKSPKVEETAEKSMVLDEKVSKVVPPFHGLLPLDHHYSQYPLSEGSASVEVLLKDKFASETEQIYPSFKCSEPMKEGFFFSNGTEKSSKAPKEEVVNEIKHRDIGTEMTPLGSSTTSRCPTPFISSSPARHNTPANRSGPLALSESSTTAAIDIAQFQECHLAKLQLGTQFDSVASYWSSKEEEEEDISKSLRHFEINNECPKTVSESKESRACAWEEEEKNKCCLRYQREEAKIQAWVNLQNAKAEAQSRKLEVKIQKMRSHLEEKLMKRMAIVHRKAEEWRTAARLQHSEQVQKASEQARKLTMINRQSPYLTGTNSCGCFPCNSHI